MTKLTGWFLLNAVVSCK